jgi:hypothetical protein
MFSSKYVHVSSLTYACLFTVVSQHLERPSPVAEILSEEKPSDREIGEQEHRLYLMQVVPNELTLKILGPISEITGLSLGSAGDQVKVNVLGANRWPHIGD